MGNISGPWGTMWEQKCAQKGSKWSILVAVDEFKGVLGRHVGANMGPEGQTLPILVTVDEFKGGPLGNIWGPLGAMWGPKVYRKGVKVVRRIQGGRPRGASHGQSS